jgi:hypothetical protein
MAYWRTNEQMATWADIFATELLNMVNFTTEKSPNIPGVDPQVNGEAVVRDAIIEDAEFFMSMNPERLEQEFNEQVRAAALVQDDAALANVRYAQSLFAPSIWTGDAAEAFHKQMTNIENFVTEQREQALTAAQAAGMMLAVSVQFRESFFSLMDMTTDVCQAAVRGQVNTGTNWKSLLVDIVAEVKSVLTTKAVADLGSGAVDKLISDMKVFTDEPVPDSDAGAIIDGYIGSRDRLKRSFQDNVGSILLWITARRTEFADAERRPELMAPLPPTTDVDGPAFRYSEFGYVDPIPGMDDTSVERERQRYVDEKPRPEPDGVIGRRLTGEGEP